VGIAMRADAVGGVKYARVITVEREGLFGMVEANDVFVAKVGSRADFDPTISIGFCL